MNRLVLFLIYVITVSDEKKKCNIIRVDENISLYHDMIYNKVDFNHEYETPYRFCDIVLVF